MIIFVDMEILLFLRPVTQFFISVTLSGHFAVCVQKGGFVVL